MESLLARNFDRGPPVSGLPLRLASAAVGVWLMVAPAVLGYGGTPANSDRITGPIAISVALVAIWDVARSVRLINLVAAAWLMLSAFLLTYPIAGSISAVISGVALAALTLPRSDPTQKYGGGWGAVVRSRRRGSP